MDFFMTTERCGFSRWNACDLALAVSLWGEPEVTRYICASGIFSTDEIANRLTTEICNFEKYGVQYFPVYSLLKGDLVGCCGLRPYKCRQAVYELGFHLREKYWHNGYAFECGTAMMNYAFDTLGAVELKAGHNPHNVASKKVLSKLGFQFEMDEFYEPTGLYHPLYNFIR